MTLVSSIIEASFRELRALDWDRNMSRLQVDEALERLDSWVRSQNGMDLGEQYSDWPLGDFGVNPQDLALYLINDPVRPPEGSRIIHNTNQAMTVYFPFDPEDGARVAYTDPFGRADTYNITFDGNGRTIEGSQSIVINLNNLVREWIYRSDLGNWMRVNSLQLTDEFPFPPEFDDYFIIGLAMRLDPRYEENLNPMSVTRYKQIKKMFYARYSRTTEVPSEVSILPLQTDRMWGRLNPFGRVISRNLTARFNRGWY